MAVYAANHGSGKTTLARLTSYATMYDEFASLSFYSNTSDGALAIVKDVHPGHNISLSESTIVRIFNKLSSHIDVDKFLSDAESDQLQVGTKFNFPRLSFNLKQFQEQLRELGRGAFGDLAFTLLSSNLFKNLLTKAPRALALVDAATTTAAVVATGGAAAPLAAMKSVAVKKLGKELAIRGLALLASYGFKQYVLDNIDISDSDQTLSQSINYFISPVRSSHGMIHRFQLRPLDRINGGKGSDPFDLYIPINPDDPSADTGFIVIQFRNGASFCFSLDFATFGVHQKTMLNFVQAGCIPFEGRPLLASGEHGHSLIFSAYVPGNNSYIDYEKKFIDSYEYNSISHSKLSWDAISRAALRPTSAWIDSMNTEALSFSSTPLLSKGLPSGLIQQLASTSFLMCDYIFTGDVMNTSGGGLFNVNARDHILPFSAGLVFRVDSDILAGNYGFNFLPQSNTFSSDRADKGDSQLKNTLQAPFVCSFIRVGSHRLLPILVYFCHCIFGGRYVYHVDQETGRVFKATHEDFVRLFNEEVATKPDLSLNFTLQLHESPVLNFIRVIPKDASIVNASVLANKNYPKSLQDSIYQLVSKAFQKE